ncbi:uncharacterized protein LOC142167349 [Nicotiana tabacum]|uniref:Uncharacterized protein LOC142167349 n=1 Tax=Nicotiana tabacum TaxID=4097 RepID=A0AC58SF62_TOBAC
MEETSMGETPFSLVYTTKALIPVEISEPSTRYTHVIEAQNEEELRMIERYYNRKDNLRYFKIGEFVLKKVFRSTKTANAGKLSPNWEGPYRVRGIAGKGAYELEIMDGKEKDQKKGVDPVFEISYFNSPTLGGLCI